MRGDLEPLSVQGRGEHVPQLGDLVVVQVLTEIDDPLLDAPGVGDHHEQQPRRGQRDHLEVTDRRRRENRVLDHRDLTGQLGQQLHRTPQDVVEVDTGIEEAQDRAALDLGDRFDLTDAVDEQPVALVGGHPTRTRVRLRDVALGLEDRHVVADGGTRHPEVVTVDQRLGSDRLLGGDVVGHDGA